MKKQLITATSIALLATGLIFSCKKKDETAPDNNNSNTATTTSGGTTGGTTGNSGALNVYLIDTAKINTITETGTNETTIINKNVNTSSYISGLSLSPDGNKIAYVNEQSANSEVRVADKTGSNDIILYNNTNSNIQIGAIRFVTNNKVCFMIMQSGASVSYSYCSVNTDATGFSATIAYYNVIDISSDEKYYISRVYSPTAPIQITDRSLDGGAGGPYYSDNFVYPVTSYPRGVFTNDNKKAVLAFIDGSTIKIREIDMLSKTATTKTIVNNFTGDASSYVYLAMASDNNRGVITVSGYGNTASTSYIFNLSTNAVTSQFTNNDYFVGQVYLY